MHTALFLILLLVLNPTTLSLAGRPISSAGPTSLVLSSCSSARYPSLCVRTLSPSSPKSPTDIAVTSTSASLSAVRATLSSLRRLPSPAAGPLRDCLQQLSDSADQLSKTINELSTVDSSKSRKNKDGGGGSRMQLDNACTWVSAALTNEDTCLDGMKGMGSSNLKEEVGGKVREAEKLTSNALYFVARLADP